MSTFYRTACGTVVLSRSFGPEHSRVNYRVSYARGGNHADMVHIGTVSRIPPWGTKWEIVDDACARTFSTRRAAIEALQRAIA